MAIYAIADLHLSFGVNKPMSIFGWDNHEEIIRQDWIYKVKDYDLVLLPGDFSWATKIEDTIKDFEFLDSLPGIKLLLKGNHDYWWNTINKLNEFVNTHGFKNIYFLYNNCFVYGDYCFVGTRGWIFSDTVNAKKMQNRETIRLELSIKQGMETKCKNIICLMHYPPIEKYMVENNIESPYIELMNKYNIKTCLYGHLHGQAHEQAIEGIYKGINLKLVSSDFLKFKLYKLI